MDILGHEIDLSFIYKIGPIEGITFHDCHFHWFVLSFRDGNKHRVEINYSSRQPSSIRLAERVRRKSERDIKRLEILRTKIINTLNNK